MDWHLLSMNSLMCIIPMRILKNSILAVITFCLLTSCNDEKLKQLESENMQLKQTAARQDSILNDFLHTFNQVESNLQTIKNREQMLTMRTNDPEFRSGEKTQMVDDIQTINELMAQNKQMIADLSSKLNRSSMKVDEFRRMVDGLNQQITAKDGEIGTLKQRLSEMDFAVEELNGRVETLQTASDSLLVENQEKNVQLEEQQSQLEEQEGKLNRAYYISGTYKELRDQEILTKQGIGFNRAPQLVNSFNTSPFREIDIREVTIIPYQGKNPALVTTHPGNAYTWSNEGEETGYLEITDPEIFWSASRYLVVVTN